MNCSVQSIELLALYFALDNCPQCISGAAKPVLVLTDNQNLTLFFESKSIHVSSWNCLDRVLSIIFLLAGIPGKANSAADFLSRMQTDPNVNLQIKFTDHVPIDETGMDTEAKAQDVSMSNIGEITPFLEELNPVVDEQFINQLKAHDDQFLAKHPGDDPDNNITGFLSLRSSPQSNLIKNKK